MTTASTCNSPTTAPTSSATPACRPATRQTPYRAATVRERFSRPPRCSRPNPPTPRRIESLTTPGPAGSLEAMLEEPDDREPRAVALVCHPHPLYGGTMLNKVVYQIGRASCRE